MSLLAFLPLLAIDININPTIGTLGPFTLTWHGFFTAVGIIGGVTLSVWLAKKDGIPSEVAQEIALVGVPSAIVGARLFYCIEHWDNFSGSWENYRSIVTGITEGGITLYGGLIGGVLGGLLYALYHRWPIGITLDAAAPGMLLGQGVGRIGDLINGEHWADRTDLPWAVRYTHPETLGEIGVAVHPTAGGYEMLGDFILMFFIIFVARKYLKAPGWSFCAYVILYGLMRFALSFTRTNNGVGGEQTYLDIPVPQLTAIVTVTLALLAAGILLKWPGAITKEWAERVGWEKKAKDDDTPTDPPPPPAARPKQPVRF